MIALAAAAALLGTTALTACGDAEEEGDSVSTIGVDPTVSCSPAPVPKGITLGFELKQGDRIPFTYEIDRHDSEDDDGSFEDSTIGEIAIGRSSNGAREIEWRLLERGAAFVLAGQGSPDQIENELGEEIAEGDVAVPLSIKEDGSVSRETDLRALRTAIRKTLTPLVERFRDEGTAEATTEQLELIGQTLGFKLVEKPGLMLYPYGYELDPERVISRTRETPAVGGRIEYVEEIEVIDAESEGGCVVIEIRDVYDPEDLKARVSEIGDVFGTFDTDEAGELSAEFKNVIHYDAGAGLIRMVEYERLATSEDQTLSLVDRFRISDPQAP